jgi:hypothetical protein
MVVIIRVKNHALRLLNVEVGCYHIRYRLPSI